MKISKNNHMHCVRTHLFLSSIILLLQCSILNAAPLHPLNGQADTLCKTLRSMGRLLLSLQDLRKAEDVFSQALSIARQQNVSDYELSQCLSDMAWVHKDMNQFTESERLYREAILLRQAAAGDEHPDMIDIWRNMADVHRQMGQYSLAEQELKKAFAIFSLYHQQDEPACGPLWAEMGQLLTEMGRAEQAEAYFQKAEDTVVGTYGPDHLYTASLYSKMANFYCIRRESCLSQNYLERAESIYTKYGITNSSMLIPDMLTKARVYALGSDYTQSLRTAKSALAAAEKTADSRTPQLAAECLGIIAEIHYSIGHFTEAEKYAKKAYKQLEISLGKTSAKSLQANYLVFKSLFHQNKMKDAESLRQELISQMRDNSCIQELPIRQLYRDLLNFNS